MTRYLLDTNIISNATKPKPSESLAIWFMAQANTDLFVSSLTIGEVWRGVLELPKGAKRNRLEAWCSGPEGPQALFAGRVLPFEERAALAWAQLMSEGTTSGRPRSAVDTMLAAIAEVHGCVIVTDNERDFSGLKVLNPLRS